MANKRFNKQVGYKDGGKAKSRVGKQVGGPMGTVGGPMSTARRDMTHGYYQPDMGMQGGQMFRGGGAVKKKGSVGVALKGGGRIKKQFGGGLNRPVARPVARPVGGVGAPVRPLAYKHGKRVTKKSKK